MSSRRLSLTCASLLLASMACKRANPGFDEEETGASDSDASEHESGDADVGDDDDDNDDDDNDDNDDDATSSTAPGDDDDDVARDDDDDVVGDDDDDVVGDDDDDAGGDSDSDSGGAACDQTRDPTIFANEDATGVQAWAEPQNVAMSDDARAIAQRTSLEWESHYLEATGYGFSIPDGATVIGITMNLERSANTTWFHDKVVRLVRANVIAGDNRATDTPWNDEDSIEAHGGPADLWGTDWTPADINATDFGAVVSTFYDSTFVQKFTARIDHMSITVHCTAP